MSKDSSADDKPFVELLDLRSITRHSDKVETRVQIVESPWEGKRHNWIICGETRLRVDRPSGLGTVPTCTLSAYLSEGVTDCEHDSAHAFSLPLIGLHFDGIEMGRVWLGAIVNPHDADSFHVPDPGYNPMEHPDAMLCEYEQCEPHIIVPQGFYVPPTNHKLFHKVAGRQVQICFGTKYDKD